MRVAERGTPPIKHGHLLLTVACASAASLYFRRLAAFRYALAIDPANSRVGGPSYKEVEKEA
jgi:hypothetical protein